MCVGNCKDPFITYLKSIGYNTVRLPKANIRPLQLLVRSGSDLTSLGDLMDVFVSAPAAPPPAVESDVVVGNIAGKRTGEMSIGIGLSVLGGVIGAMGGSKLGLDGAYKNAKTAEFEFTDVLSDSVSPAKLDAFLGGSDVNPSAVTVAQLLDADEVYVITSTLKSRRLLVEGKTASGSSLDVDVPVVQQIVGGKVKVSVSGSTSGKVGYEGAVPLVFGFQAVRLYYDRGAYTSFKPLEPGTVAARALEFAKADGTELLMTNAAFVALHVS